MMISFWPLGTLFKIKSEDAEETWIVDSKAELGRGVISSLSPFGQFLLSTVESKKFRFQQPDGEEIEYEVISIEPPPIPEGQSESISIKTEVVEVNKPPQPAIPLSKFTAILQTIEQGQSLGQDNEKWLENHGHFRILAEYYENLYIKTDQAIKAVVAGKYWRKAGNAELALKATEGFSEWKEGPQLMSMVLTNRGGAYKDLSNLPEAEKCARKAIELTPDRYHPYNLLGAILYQSGEPEQATKHFEKAEELGSPSTERDRAIINAIRRAGRQEREKVREFLKLTNFRQYEKYRQYLEQ